MGDGAVSRLIIVSNRVSVAKGRGAAGAQGGLAVAMAGALNNRGGMWFGWSGKEVEHFTGQLTMERGEEFTTATIDLEQQDIDEYYNGYANRTIWPLFHYRMDLAEYNYEFGRGYDRVNERFASSLLPLIESDDLIWVQDYHLMPLAQKLRGHAIKNRIGLFLHIPWPPTGLLVTLPHHQRLVTALLEFNVLGFQSQEALGNFYDYCRNQLSLNVDEERSLIEFGNNHIMARAFPIGVDAKLFSALADTKVAKEAEARMSASALGRKIAIGVDRLDYSKGLPERIDALEHLTTLDQDLVRKLLFVQIAPPSREDVLSYQNIRTTLEQKAGQFNGMHSDFDLVPIRYVNRGFQRASLFGFYRASHIGLVTPLRDGMNLVAKEYVAAQNPENPGVLILSRFAGAAEQLTDALLVNPHSTEEVAHHIKLAMEMSLTERQARWQNLNDKVQKHDVIHWANDFIHALDSSSEEPSHIMTDA